jgi:hypothetical protein
VGEMEMWMKMGILEIKMPVRHIGIPYVLLGGFCFGSSI